MSKEMGKDQKLALKALKEHGSWPGRWTMGGGNRTPRILNSLVRRGEVTVSDTGTYRIANVDSLKLRVEQLGKEYNVTVKAWQDAAHTVLTLKQDAFRSGADLTDYGNNVNFSADIIWAASKLEHMLDVKRNHLHKQLVNAQVKLDALRIEAAQS